MIGIAESRQAESFQLSQHRTGRGMDDKRIFTGVTIAAGIAPGNERPRSKVIGVFRVSEREKELITRSFVLVVPKTSL
jgi:hypothetical protein